MAQYTLHDALLNWACSECLSPRWAFKYEGAVTPEVMDVIRASSHETVSTLPDDVQEALLGRLKKHRVFLLSNYLKHPYCVEKKDMAVAEIAGLNTMHEMHWQKWDVSLKEFSTFGFDNSNARDPRRVADSISYENNISFKWIPIAVKVKDRPVPILIEGYARCISLLRAAAAAQTQQIFVCE